MSHFFMLHLSRRTKTERSPIFDAMRVERSKAWNFDDIKFCVSTYLGRDPIQNADDRVLASLLQRAMVAQPPPEVWDRIKESAGQMRGTHFTG